MNVFKKLPYKYQKLIISKLSYINKENKELLLNFEYQLIKGKNEYLFDSLKKISLLLGSISIVIYIYLLGKK